MPKKQYIILLLFFCQILGRNSFTRSPYHSPIKKNTKQVYTIKFHQGDRITTNIPHILQPIDCIGLGDDSVKMQTLPCLKCSLKTNLENQKVSYSP